MKQVDRRKPKSQDPAPVRAANPSAKAPSDNTNLIICIVLAVITLAIYSPVRAFDFTNYDDGDYVILDQYVQQGLSLAGLKWSATAIVAGNWHPLTMISLMLNRDLFGAGAGGFHIINLLFHIGNAVLLFLVLKSMTGARWRSAIVAALFAWHPLHVESVAWIAERKDVLSGFFWLLTMLAYTRYVRQQKPLSYCLALFFFALALMSKPMAVTLPFVLLLMDYWPLRRIGPGAVVSSSPQPSLSRVLAEKVPFLALTIAVSIITFAIQDKAGGIVYLDRFSLWDRIANAFVSYQRYLEKTVVPVNLSVFYPYPTWPIWRVGCAILLFIAITVWVVRQLKRTPFLAVGWFWYLGTLVPVIGLIQAGNQSMADRYTYLPLIGIFVMAAWGIHDLAQRRRELSSLVAPLAAVALLGSLIGTFLQLRHWQNSFTLFEHALSVTRENGIAHKCLADAMLVKGQLNEAVPHYKEALRLVEVKSPVHFSYGITLGKLGDIDGAIVQYKETLRIRPDHADAHYNLGNIYYRRSQWADAAKHYTEAAKLKPGSADIENNLASSLMMAGQFDAAAPHFAEALRINPSYENAYLNLGLIRMRQGKPAEAIVQFRAGLNATPSFIPLMDRLAWVLSTTEDAKVRNGAEAVQFAERACNITNFKEPDLLATLAAAYAEAGRFPDAINTIQKALTLLGARQPALINTLQQQLQLYQAGKPIREPAQKQ